MAPAIVFRSVSKRLPDSNLALADATWTVPEGARACLLGPANSGKTTAVHILQGALRPTGGSVHVFGTLVGGPGFRQVRRQMGFLPQGGGMYPDLTAGEYIGLAARISGVGARRAAETFGLAEHLHTRMNHLSTSIQRRLALATALVADPELLVLDEPTIALDQVAARDLQQHLWDAMQGRTSLLCTHQIPLAQALCDHFVLMRSGRVLAQGSPDEVRRRARPRLRLAARQGVAVLLTELQNMELRAEPGDGGVLVEVSDPEVEAPGLLRRLLEKDIDIYECGSVRTSIEDLFPEALR